MKRIAMQIRIPLDLYEKILKIKSTTKDDKGKPISFNEWFLIAFKKEIIEGNMEKDEDSMKTPPPIRESKVFSVPIPKP